MVKTLLSVVFSSIFILHCCRNNCLHSNHQVANQQTSTERSICILFRCRFQFLHLKLDWPKKSKIDNRVDFRPFSFSSSAVSDGLKKPWSNLLRAFSFYKCLLLTRNRFWVFHWDPDTQKKSKTACSKIFQNILKTCFCIKTGKNASIKSQAALLFDAFRTKLSTILCIASETWKSEFRWDCF